MRVECSTNTGWMQVQMQVKGQVSCKVVSLAIDYASGREHVFRACADCQLDELPVLFPMAGADKISS
jgi:hypothetical protein